MSGIFFTSDHHFGHTNIIESCDRPYKYACEMDEDMIRKWNNVVSPKDKVYYLGDLSFHGREKTDQILRRLKGDIFYIKGNHDKSLNRYEWRFKWIKDLFDLKVDNKTSITLCHYAMRSWNKSSHGSYHLYGHSHGNLPGTLKSFDIGVDNWNFTPVPLSVVMHTFRLLGEEIEDKDKG